MNDFKYAKYRKWFINEHIYNTEIGSTFYQKVATPEHIVNEMINLFPKEDFTWVVLYDPNFVEYLLNNRITTKDNIIFIADDEHKAVYLKGMYETVFPTPEEISNGQSDSTFLINTIEFTEGFSSNNFKQLKTEIEGINMKFTKLAVVGNPPYQSEDGGHSRSAKPIYNLFIENIIDNIKPEYFSMIVPSRWMVGGKGLDSFRSRMINDDRIEHIVDNMTCNGIFGNDADISGGVNYFLWNKNHKGECTFNGISRKLNEYDIIIRENENRNILNKVVAKTNNWLSAVVSPRKPYGFEGDTTALNEGIPCWFKQSIGLAFVNPSIVTNPRNDLHLWKVMVPRAPIAGQTDFTKPISFFNDRNIIIAKPGEVCTETYIVLNSFDSETKANNFVTYLKTKFFRFMLRLRVVSQDITRDSYAWVPDMEDYSKEWIDVELYRMFDLTSEEIQYIESKIKTI